MGGGFESKPGGRSLVQSIVDAPVGAVAGPGKRTLTEQLGEGVPSSGTTGYAVQRKASSPPPVDPVATAQAGTSGAGSSLPYASQIQALFGRHDVAGVRSYVGGAAAEASSALGARAFAVGDAVGFATQPDLHTAAHEAAHVVQQQRGVALAGGIDTPGDTHERHADAVADEVVAGRSAESLLDAHAGGASGTAAVQRDTKQASSNATQPEDPPPPRGTFRVEVAGAGDYTFVFNSADLRSGTSPAQVAFSFYMKDVFPGVTSGQIDAVFKSNHVFFVHGDQIPDGEHEYLVNVRPPFHNAIIATMKRVAPHLHVVEPQVGTAALPGAVSAGGTGTSPTGTAKGAAKTKGQLGHAGGDEHTDAGSTTVELDRALYDRLLKEFPETVALHGPQAWPALLAFLADHAAELKQLPHTKTAVKSLSIAELEKLLEAFKQHQRQADTGDHNGKINGADEAKRGVEAGVDGGNANTQNTKGTKGGATEGEGDSKYGWVRWVPKGEIGVQPELPQYIAGSELKAKLQWDLSVHPDAGLVLLANHCRYAWIVKHNGKVVDGSSKAYLHDNREVYLDLDGGPGDYEITVTATSKHFKTEDHEYSIQHTVKAIAETDFDRQTFDAAQTGPDATFARDDAGKLHLNKDQQALTAAQEITTLDLTRGHVDELGKEGKITGSSQQALDDELDHERDALKKIQAKTGAGAPYVVRGTFVGRETSTSETLRLMMAMTERSQDKGTAKVGLLLHDITTGEPTRHPGDGAQPIGKDPSAALERAEVGALDDMADHFHAHNDYSKGTVHLAAQRLASDAVWEKTIETNNWRKKSTKVLHGVAMVGGALLMVVPGGQVVAVGVLLATTSVATAAALAIDIQDRVAKEGTLKFDRRLVMDMLQVATLVLPFGAMTKVLAEASQVAKTRFALSMVALDGAQGFVMAQDVRHQLILIEANAEQQLADATTDEERADIRARRDQNVAQVLGGAVTSGAFMLVSMGAGLKHVLATSRAGRSFHVREPVARLGEGPRATMEQTLTDGAFAHGEQHVEITPEERLYLEHQIAAPEPKAVSDAKPAADSHDKVPVGDESHKAPHERTTQKDMKAVDPNVDPATGATGVTFQGRGDRIGALARKVAPEPGYFDVVVHGDGKSFAVLHDGEWVKITPNSVRKYIRAQKGYHGQPIRLLSCEAGAEGAITAQAVADGLDVHVKAATEKLWFSQDKTTGAVELIIGNDPKRPSGGWAEFDPHGAKPTAPESKAPVDEPTLPPHERATDRLPAQPDPTVDEHAAKHDENTHEQVPLGKPLEPVPPKDVALIKAQSDEHVERVREETVQDAPESETNRIKEAAYKKADETYQKSASQQRKPKDARKDASEAAKALAKTEWLAARERLTRDAADRTIDDGSVFERSQMSDPAKQQLDAYRSGAAKGGPTEGAHAQRLATRLPGNTVPAMESMLDAEAAAGTCRRDNERTRGRGGSVQIQPTYYFNDGSVIRLKPEGDGYNGWKPSFSIEVKNSGVPAAATTEQPDIAFKVDARGRAVPKDAKEIANPYGNGKYTWQRDRFDDLIIYAGHQLVP
jgi:hypothetical protein